MGRGAVLRHRVRRLVTRGMPLRLSVGAGGIVQAGWISVDEHDLDVTRRDSWERFLGATRADAILAEDGSISHPRKPSRQRAIAEGSSSLVAISGLRFLMASIPIRTTAARWSPEVPGMEQPTTACCTTGR
jgi:hypothetical protein